MANPRNLELMDRAREASVIEAAVGPYVQERISRIVQQLVAHYRGGQATHDLMLGGIAGISELMGMMSDLENKQQQGVVASNREMSGDPAARTS